MKNNCCDKNYRLSFTEEAMKIVGEMTFEEKVMLLAGKCKWTTSMGIGSYNSVPYPAGGCERLGVPEMLFCDGPRGCVSGESTCFPVSMARGATFDRELEERIGKAIGAEIRANGGNFFGGVCINVPYNPGAGRSQETYGEDSVHIGAMASALVRGVQSRNVIACIKHFAFNSMENSRFWVNVTADKRTEREIYLRHFKECIDTGAASVMSSYNRYHGVFNGANDYLLRRVLKEEWDFDGFVVSDFMMGLHSTSGGLKGGLDVEMNIRRKYTVRKIRKAVKDGSITMNMVDEAALRIVRTLLAFTRNEDEYAYPSTLIACKEHIALAREAAEKSITLIRNRKNLLPLDKNKIRKLAVLGDLANEENIGDNGSSQVHPPYIKTFMQALEENYDDVNTVFIPTSQVKARKNEIASADAVVVVCGMKHSDEGEYIVVIGGDRKDLGLRSRDVEMLKTAGNLNRNSIAVLMGGNMLRVNEWHGSLGAVLMAYYPGMEGGNAIADVIFGKVNPGGKLPFAIGKRDEDFPQVDWLSMNQHYDYYHGYKKLDKENKDVDYPFGFGLSYTTFNVSEPRFVMSDGETAVIEADVENTGRREGSETVQLYISWKNSAVDRPVRELRDFRRVYLKAGEKETVRLFVKKSDLAYYDENNGWQSEDITYIANVSTDERKAALHTVEFSF